MTFRKGHAVKKNCERFYSKNWILRGQAWAFWELEAYYHVSVSHNGKIRGDLKFDKKLKAIAARKIWKNKTLELSESHSQMFFVIGVLKNFANFTGEHLCWSLFFIKLQAWTPAALLKRDSNTGVFLWNLQDS